MSKKITTWDRDNYYQKLKDDFVEEQSKSSGDHAEAFAESIDEEFIKLYRDGIAIKIGEWILEHHNDYFIGVAEKLIAYPSEEDLLFDTRGEE